jgi:hypothetical protein
VAAQLSTHDERELAVDLFNYVWTLLELPQRSPEQDDELIHAAHASRHHWGRVGTPANLARGEWQLSRVYATLGRAEPALHHARRCVAYCEASPEAMEDWDLPFAYEALARANAVAGDEEESAHYLARAREVGDLIEGAEERALLDRDLATI